MNAFDLMRTAERPPQASLPGALDRTRPAALDYRLCEAEGQRFWLASSPRAHLVLPCDPAPPPQARRVLEAACASLPRRPRLLFPVSAAWARCLDWPAVVLGEEHSLASPPRWEQRRYLRALEQHALQLRTRSLAPGALGPWLAGQATLRELLRAWRSPSLLAPMHAWLDPLHGLAPRAHEAVWLEARGRVAAVAVAAHRALGQSQGDASLVLLARCPQGPKQLSWGLLCALAERFHGPLGLGLSPLTGPVPAWLRAIAHHSQALYAFESLGRFKRRIGERPAAARLLVYEPALRSEISAILELLRCFAGGGFRRFAWQSLQLAAAPRWLSRCKGPEPC